MAHARSNMNRYWTAWLCNHVKISFVVNKLSLLSENAAVHGGRWFALEPSGLSWKSLSPQTSTCVLFSNWIVLGQWGRHAGSVCVVLKGSAVFSSLLQQWHIPLFTLIQSSVSINRKRRRTITCWWDWSLPLSWTGVHMAEGRESPLDENSVVRCFSPHSGEACLELTDSDPWPQECSTHSQTQRADL